MTKEEAEARELEWKLVRVFSDAYAEEIRTALAGGEGEAGGSDSRQKVADEEDRTAEVDGRRNIVLDQVRSWLDNTNAAPDAVSFHRVYLRSFFDYHLLLLFRQLIAPSFHLLRRSS